MITAIDSSVLLSIAKNEPAGSDWISCLRENGRQGRLIVGDVALAELAAMVNDDELTLRFFDSYGIDIEPTLAPAAMLAGRIFRSYRRAGGPREHLIPDFLVGAHALLQADQLAAADRGYLRRYFPKLRVIGPGRTKSH